MFDPLLRELRDLERATSISVKIETDEKGYLDRCCPSTGCNAHFKVFSEDWSEIVSDKVAYCPRCGHSAVVANWDTPAQKRRIERTARNHVQKRIDAALQRGVRQFNARQQKNDLVKITMSYRPSHPPLLVPKRASEVMTQEYQCTNCRCKYASIGAAFFCPTCGNNSILETFGNSIETVMKTIAAIPSLRQKMEDMSGKDTAEDMVRQIIENNLVKVVASFQKYAEVCFFKLANTSSLSIRPNLFQNIGESDKVWRDATATGYVDILGAHEYQRLVIYFQQRHVLEHQDGFIDQRYIDRSGDTRFRVGQRLVVRESNVLDLVSIIQRLSKGIADLSGI